MFLAYHCIGQDFRHLPGLFSCLILHFSGKLSLLKSWLFESYYSLMAQSLPELTTWSRLETSSYPQRSWSNIVFPSWLNEFLDWNSIWLWQSSENSKVILGSDTAKELAENSLMRSSKYNREKVRASEKHFDRNTELTDSDSHFAYMGILKEHS